MMSLGGTSVTTRTTIRQLPISNYKGKMQWTNQIFFFLGTKFQRFDLGNWTDQSEVPPTIQNFGSTIKHIAI